MMTVMRKLSTEKRAMILNALVEGTGINATARLVGVSKLTVLRLLADAGAFAADLHDLMVRDLACERIQADEIWGFVGCKEKTRMKGGEGYGDAWTWIAMDADTKLVVSYLTGERDDGYAHEFAMDVRSRILNRPQISTDGLRLYSTAIVEAFGLGADFAQITKIYAKDGETLTGVRKVVRTGNPDDEHIATSYAERLNLSVRMRNRRMTRRTNAHSKIIEQHEAMMALTFLHYNFIRRHETLKTTPAVAAGLANSPWTTVQFVKMMEDEERRLGGRISNYQLSPKRAPSP